MDPEEYRRAAHEQWTRSAPGWERQRALVQSWGMPVSRWLIDAVNPQPGQTILELAAGPGDTGLLAAELVAPGGGRLISSDLTDEMLDVARRRAEELGVDNVEFRRLDMESLDLDAASVDGVLARWGYMLLADPAAALRETRRVLRPGGMVALAAWDAPERNPWATMPTAVLVERGLAEPPDRTGPGMFAFAPPGRIDELLEDAGFTDIVVDAVDLTRPYTAFEEYWESLLDLSRPFADALERAESDELDAVRAALEQRASAYRGEDGRLSLPGRTLVAAAQA